MIKAEKTQEKEEDEERDEESQAQGTEKESQDKESQGKESKTKSEEGEQGRTTREKNDRIMHHQIERNIGKYERVVTLDHDIDPKTVKVSFKDGVLKVKIPKTPRSQQTHKISF
jgi:HSP20 family molecular chaperone IbpA